MPTQRTDPASRPREPTEGAGGASRLAAGPGHREHVEGLVELLLGQPSVGDVAPLDDDLSDVRCSLTACLTTAAAAS